MMAGGADRAVPGDGRADARGRDAHECHRVDPLGRRIGDEIAVADGGDRDCHPVNGVNERILLHDRREQYPHRHEEHRRHDCMDVGGLGAHVELVRANAS